jgi:hypothetical protein
MVCTASDPGSAYHRAKSPDFSYFFLIFPPGGGNDLGGWLGEEAVQGFRPGRRIVGLVWLFGVLWSEGSVLS